MSLINRLKYWRHKHEMNQKEFAEFLGVGPSLLNRWELQRHQPSLEQALKISKKLGVPIEDLLEPPEE